MPACPPHITRTTSNFEIGVYQSASSLPASVWETFRTHPGQSNIIFAHALKTQIKESKGAHCQGNLWMTLSSDTLDFVLSCTVGPLGNYPVFIFTPHPMHMLSEQFIGRRILHLVTHLQKYVPVQRVFSVFAPAMVAGAFVSFWRMRTGVAPIEEPYYDATLSYCDSKSFVNDEYESAYTPDCEPRPATEADIPQIAKLCKMFAATSVCLRFDTNHLLTILASIHPR